MYRCGFDSRQFSDTQDISLAMKYCEDMTKLHNFKSIKFQIESKIKDLELKKTIVDKEIFELEQNIYDYEKKYPHVIFTKGDLLL